MDPLEAMNLRIRDRLSTGVSREPKSRLLLILPGPLWEVKDSLRKRLERLSESFEGVVMTSMQEAGRTRIGAFTLDALRFRRDR
ncbi:MAG TPA: hypothetical protein VK465_05850, partial [Fibrobacteria bacterium]|nr:hypothetical protein [Fibrobacteria bacterium]